MHSRKRDVTITVNGGTGQTGNVGATLGTPLSVNVKNYLGANYSGVQVEWLVDDDSFCTPSASLTNGSGIASTDLTLGTAAGTVTVTARVGKRTVTITATKTATGAATIAANSVTDQSGTTSATVAAPPSVLVVDGQGNPVSGVSITWAVTAGGGSVNTTGATTTGATGVATLTSWTLGASAGLNTVTATSAGLSGSPVTFNANGVASAPTQIAVTSGGSQTGVTAGSAATATQFTVRDAGNNPVQGVTVSFSVTTGSGSLSVASAVTNASGQASVTYTTHTTVETATIAGSFTNAGGTVVTASTTIASAAGAKTKLAIQTQPASNGTSGVALTQQPIILIQDANSNTVLTATDTITAAVQSGNATIAGNTQAAVAGVATFTALTLTDADGGVNVLRFSTGALTTVDSTGTTLAPPIPAGLQFGTQPTNVTVGQATLGCTVYVVDSGGGLVPGATNAVTITVTGGGASLTGTTTVNAVGGVATFAGVAVSAAGTFTLDAAASGLTGATSTSFTATAASSTHEPSDVSMTAQINTEWTGITADTSFTTGQTYGGLKAGSAASRLTVRSLTDQSWRNANASAFPASPSGGVVLCSTMTNGQGSGYMGLLYKALGSPKTVYCRAYALLSSNFEGENSGQYKYIDQFRTGGSNVYIGSFHGTNSNNIRSQHYFQGTPSPVGWQAGTGDTLTRNQWYQLEWLLVQESAAGAADGHCTMWKDGTMTSQITGVSWQASGSSTWSQFELLHYWGGTGDTISTPGACYVLTDSLYVSTSTSRAAAP